ncbi:uroplakin-3a [Bombina bombina]|uniref:uroplakin-3a n=1 Tax=Bombina bombina TaxID=8345 RepID=UPI00235A5E32|nr:uroplakin-3a [Bombina bombina]
MGWVQIVLTFWLMQIRFGDSSIPILANSKYFPINPSLTTVTLEKPYCVFTGLGGKVYLFAYINGAANKSVTYKANANDEYIITSTYSVTNGGRDGPYIVDSFDIPICPQSLENISSPIYFVFRVGSNVSCVDDPNTAGPCNAPLLYDTTYRFKYVVADANRKSLGQTDWSAKIATRKAKSYDTIDTWPGRRSGGMIVITSILSVLLFFLLAGFVAAVVSNFMTEPSGIATTTHETRSSLNVPQKQQTSSEPGLSAERERYSINPQA